MQEASQHYGNASASHDMGKKSLEYIEIARKQIANTIGAKPNEIIFCSSGTEANNLALQGYLMANYPYECHVITSSIEHASVLNTLNYLYGIGYDFTLLPVDRQGIVDIDYLQRSIRRGTALISIMYVNNEVGSIQQIKQIAEIAKRYGICVHTDAVQAYGHLPISINDLCVDMLSLSAHKIYSSKGIGALYVRENINLQPMIFGCCQEYGLRSGTENFVNIAAFRKGAELATAEMQETENKLAELKERLIQGVTDKISGVVINSNPQYTLPSILNMSFYDVYSLDLVRALNDEGIYVSDASICPIGNRQSSRVLTAMGLPQHIARGGVRFSFGRYNTIEDADYILDVLQDIITNLRKGAR